MLATQMPDVPLEAKDVKQIKDKLAQSLKALQKRYVTSDTVVTSEDGDANLLCCALEAIFIHGIKTKYIRSEAGSRRRKGNRGHFPQPFFWSLLKTVTHRDVVTELEKISFLTTDVGRCRAWLRLALNHGLLECYLASLFREDSKLRAYYQPTALLLNTEEREVLFSYLQGLASLTFNLSYKSAVLNEWTTTPLALAGLCPAVQGDTLKCGDFTTPKPTCKELWDTTSQSSGSSDVQEAPRVCPVLTGSASAGLQGGETALTSSNLSLDTAGSSQFSSSLSSDSLLQGQDPPGLTGEQWSSSDLDTPVSTSSKKQQNSLADFRESGHCSQDSMRDDYLISSSGPDQDSEKVVFSGSDSEAQGPATPSEDKTCASELQPTPPEQTLNHVTCSSSEACISASAELESDKFSFDIKAVESIEEECKAVEPVEEKYKAGALESQEPFRKENESEILEQNNSLLSSQEGPHCSASVLSGKLSSDSVQYPRSWISEDDFYKPHLENLSDDAEVSPSAPIAEVKVPQLPPSVVHRRQIGLSNPFRGLLKLGHLERRGAMGLWRDYYCELSPFEFVLYLNADERTSCDSYSLLRCEDIRITTLDGRFDLTFPGKRLHLRAANHDEAQDWTDRIVEAVNKYRPAPQADDHWEVLEPFSVNGVDALSPPSAPSSPNRGVSPGSRTRGGQEQSPPQEFDWTQTTDLETDAIKEEVLYFSADPEARTWVPLVFSLSLEVLKSFEVKDGRKLLRQTYHIQEIRDVVPDVSVGGPAFFKLLTVKETLRLRAENANEARSWRDSIREALDSYLESGEDGGTEGHVGVTGNLYRLVKHRLKDNGALLAHLYTVPSEKGLDTQNFICAGCPKQIGPSLGRARLCHFSGQYYCSSCHHGDTTIIPSRMVHNWDIVPREVSQKALHLLAQVEQEPLLDLEQLNPELVTHAEPMAQAHRQRQRLRLLGDYLLTCRSGACKKLQARMEQRTYLLESSHLYSVLDLRQVAEGQYVTYLMKLSQYAAKHVFHCDLCTQRGFFCQICHDDDIIFPFQFDSTTRCKVCKTVFHLTCKAPEDACPRCERMRKYLERDLVD
ncbi:pleckstrin homology domain-containing family M member 1 [Antennarius striatus]|uniref:pleckstrin homology domain-containing family M member 1 n=1 Tax=Antennarius striatus TaxID=241820 RepID=UPI0035AD909F